MPNSTRRRIGNRAASPAMMHENTRSRSAAASGGTPSLAREEADDQAAALIRQADGDTTGAELTDPPRNFDSESDHGSDSSDSPNDNADADAAASRRRTEQRLAELGESQPTPHAGLAASQFAAVGIEMLPGSATDLGTSAGPETTSAQSTSARPGHRSNQMHRSSRE